MCVRALLRLAARSSHVQFVGIGELADGHSDRVPGYRAFGLHQSVGGRVDHVTEEGLGLVGARAPMRLSSATPEPSLPGTKVPSMSVETAIPLILIGFPALVIWLWALVDAARNPAMSTAKRVAWLVAVIVLPGVGALLYVGLPGRKRLLVH